jgi:hypothetical protein
MGYQVYQTRIGTLLLVVMRRLSCAEEIPTAVQKSESSRQVVLFSTDGDRIVGLRMTSSDSTCDLLSDHSACFRRLTFRRHRLCERSHPGLFMLRLARNSVICHALQILLIRIGSHRPHIWRLEPWTAPQARSQVDPPVTRVQCQSDNFDTSRGEPYSSVATVAAQRIFDHKIGLHGMYATLDYWTIRYTRDTMPA